MLAEGGKWRDRWRDRRERTWGACLPTTVSMFPFCGLRQRLSCQDNHKTTSASSSRQRLSCRDKPGTASPSSSRPRLSHQDKLETANAFCLKQGLNCQDKPETTKSSSSRQIMSCQNTLYTASISFEVKSELDSQCHLWGQDCAAKTS